MGKLIIPDIEIAGWAIQYWPEPTHYQATIMTTIALMESGGNTYGIAVNDGGLFKGYADRGLWGINEAAIVDVIGAPVDAWEFSDPRFNAAYARVIWDWRIKQAKTQGFDFAHQLIYAYEGWSTYKYKSIDPQLKAAWPVMWNRAKAGVQSASVAA